MIISKINNKPNKKKNSIIADIQHQDVKFTSYFWRVMKEVWDFIKI